MRLTCTGISSSERESPECCSPPSWAVRWLLHALRLEGPEILPIYLGDDLTDEDAFRELTGDGVGIVVGRPDRPTFAQFGLEDTFEVEQFLRQLSDRSPDEE